MASFDVLHLQKGGFVVQLLRLQPTSLGCIPSKVIQATTYNKQRETKPRTDGCALTSSKKSNYDKHDGVGMTLQRVNRAFW